MKFDALRTLMSNRPYFRSEDLHMGRAILPYELVQLSHWTQEGKVVRLKKGYYTLSAENRKRPLSALELADALYRPSYISLEWALSRFGMIPEAVGTLTSVSPLKTAIFQNDFGSFSYKHIAQNLFSGFTQEKLPAPHFLATPEKAVLDFIHLSIPRSQKITQDILIRGYRFQNLGILKKNRLIHAVESFRTPRIQAAGKIILDLLRKNHD